MGHGRQASCFSWGVHRGNGIHLNLEWAWGLTDGTLFTEGRFSFQATVDDVLRMEVGPALILVGGVGFLELMGMTQVN